MTISSFDMGSLSPYFTAWMLTYLIHSSVILGLTCLLWKWLPDSALPAKELILKLGLVGGLLTASLQIGLGLTPLAGAWELQSSNDPPGTTTASLLPPPVLSAAQPIVSRQSSATPPHLDPIARGTETSPPSLISAPRMGAASAWLSLAWLLGAGILTAGLMISYLRLHALLSGRVRLEKGPLFELLARLVRVAGARRAVRLSSSSRIAIPLARGVVRGEICLPHRAVGELTPEHHEIVLAHELAHLERWDPAWLLAARLIESLLFFQPLNRIVRRHLQEVAEYRCDDRAVQQTGRPITMARVLTDIAERSLRGRRALLAPAMASDRSRLGRRITRLVDRDYPHPEDPLSRWLALAAVLSLAVLVIAAPGFSTADTRAEKPLDAQDSAAVTEIQSMPVVPSSPDTLAAPAPVAAGVSDSEPLPVPSPAPAPVKVVDPIDPETSLAFEAAIKALIAEIESSVALEMAALEEDFAIQIEALDPELEAMTYEITLMASELAEQASHLAEAAAPTEEQLEALQLKAQRLAEIELPEEEIEELRERARDLAERARPSREDLDRLRDQARELADSFRMDEESMTAMRERARTLAEQAQPSREQLEQLHDRIRETFEEWRAERLREREAQDERETTEPQQ